MTEIANDVAEQLDRLTKTVRDLDGAVESLILNETAVLEGLAQMLNVIHQMQTRSEESQQKHSEQIHQFGLLIASHLETRSSHMPIVLPASKSDSENPETALLQHLYAFLPDSTAIDIGAHWGETTEVLLASGYSVIAFEPFPESFSEIERKSKAGENLRAFPWAIGPEDGKMDLHVASSRSGDRKRDVSLFHTLVPHAADEDLDFSDTIPVKVRSLGSLVLSGEIPNRVGLLKIDTEGFDLDVVRGIGELRASAVMVEFWDAEHEFGKSGRGRLDDLVTAMKQRGYGWYLVIYHLDAKSLVSYYHNRPDTVPGSWGNAIFFEDQQIFAESMRWVEHMLPPTLFR
ncbi:MAG: FkbM family methyltransferase [Terracidiphilus sp.]|jgi:FkbM family methyltransferase